MILSYADYKALKKRVWCLLRDVKTSEYDRVEDVINGFYIRAYRKTINCKTTYHLSYRLEWQSHYSDIHPSRLTEWIAKT